MNEHKLFTQRIGLIAITNLLLSLSGIILLPILTRSLPIEEYGIWVQISVTIGLVPAIATLGLPYTMVRFLAVAKKREEIQEGFYSIAPIVLFTSAIASLLLFLFSEPIAAALLNDNLTIARILSLIIFIECLNGLLLNFFRTFQQIRRYSIFTLIRTLLMVVLVACFVLSGYGILGAVIGLLISSLVLFLIQAFLIVSEIGITIPKFKHTREYLAFGLPTIPTALSHWVVNSSDRYVIGIFLGTAFVGYYSPGYVLGSIINMFMAPLFFMLPAVLSKYYDENNVEAVKTALRYSLKYFLLLAIPSAFGLSLLSKPLVTILSTPEIASQGYLITPFVALSSLLLGAYVVIAQILIVKKKTKIEGIVSTMAAILNLGLNLILVPYIGILGAAITTLIAFTFAFILITHYSFKYLIFDIEFPFILKSILASIVMSLVILTSAPAGIFNVIIVIGVCAVVYATVLLLLGGIKKEEIVFFRELFRL
ncbi:polysaccharide biosynthesis C-terminal domain-containing protein [Dehalococcoidia bacterium]|nr:polysaccharide biosynthesis C-terminal domain-containing protein [Dehalococcoidia bacterium]